MNSRDYWRQREEEASRYHIKGDEKIKRSITAIYDDLLESIETEINGFYGRYATKEGISIAEAKRRADKLDIERYEKKAKKYVETHDLSKQANEEMRLYNLTMKVNRLELLKAKIGLELVKGFSRVDTYFETHLTERAMETFERLGGILNISLPSQRTVDALVNTSFRNARFSDDIWGYELELKNKLSTLLTRGLIQGKSSQELARELRKTFDVTKYESERLMKTELCRVETEAQLNSIRKAGFTQYQFHNIANGRRVCDECRQKDGKIFRLSEYEIGDTAPPIHPNCQCSISPYEDNDEYQKWLENYKASKMTKKILGKYLEKL